MLPVRWVVIFMLAAFGGDCVAYFEEYPPFETDNPFPVCDLTPVQTDRTEDEPYVFSYIDSEARFYVWNDDSYEWYMRMENSAGEILVAPFSIGWRCLAGIGNVYKADLNRDGTADFFLHTWYCGAGLSALNEAYTFFLSNGNKFDVVAIDVTVSQPEDFIRIPQDNECVLLHLTGASAEAGMTADGKYHNFWVYNLLRFRGSAIVVDNSVIKGFPRWIWFTESPNRKETRMLSPAQKVRLWDSLDLGNIQKLHASPGE